MESWLEWARGPVFIFALTFMVLGLIRHVALTLWEIGRAMRRAGDKTLPYGQIALATVKWLLPVGKIADRLVLSVTSFLFHVAVIIVPLFLGGHIALWARGLGISWASVSWLAIPNLLADVLTIVAEFTTTQPLPTFTEFSYSQTSLCAWLIPIRPPRRG